MHFVGTIYIEKGIIKSTIPGDKLQIFSDGGLVFSGNGFAYPGLGDSHGHVTPLGMAHYELDLSNTTSAEECCSLALNHNFYKEGWIHGRGWNHELFNTPEFPDKKILDHYFPDIPVYFTRIDGHAAWANSKALEIAGISLNSTNPTGGEIVKDKSGNPTGIIVDNAMNLVLKHIPDWDTEQLSMFFNRACDLLSDSGLTSVHDMDVNPGLIKILAEVGAFEQIPLNVIAYVSAQNDEYPELEGGFQKNGRYIVRGVKFYADGALGSKGAALLNGYRDDRENKGLPLIDEENLYEKASCAIEKGFHVATHAIGDAANRLVINVYEKLRKSYPEAILRIEHAQIVHPNDIHRMADLNIHAAVQPIHCISDAKMAEKRLDNETLKRAYPWKSLLDAGVLMAGGSDFPIESYNPLLGTDAFVNRKPKGRPAWYPDERISIASAIEAYTSNVNHICGAASTAISAAQPANITILDNSLENTPTDKISAIKPLCTVINGKIGYNSLKMA